MNNNQILTNLKIFIDTIKDLWIWFIDDHLEVFEGKRNYLQSFGIEGDEAEECLADWQKFQRNAITDMYADVSNDNNPHSQSIGES